MRRAEQAIQRAVFEHLAWRARPNAFAFHVPNGGWRSPIEAAIMKGLGVRPGVPDVFAGRAHALELKAPGAKLSPAQAEAHAALKAAGAAVAVVYGLDDALAQPDAWGLLR
jgi:hypothetical protein